MTEVPEHLLKRSRDRRAALGLGGGDEGGDAAPATTSEPAAASSASAPARAAASAPVVAAPKPPPFIPPYVLASERRKRVPLWTMPVLALLPVWAILYAQSLSAAPSKELSQLASGQAVYATNCSACHGGTGGGGSGRPLAAGEVLKTFPNIVSQLQYVKEGDAGINNGKYGDPNRQGPEGQHGGGYNGAFMPAWPNLTDAELLEVVRHERETLSGEEVPGAMEDAGGNLLWPNGTPFLNSSGALQWDDAEPMFEDGKLTKPADPAVPVE